MENHNCNYAVNHNTFTLILDWLLENVIYDAIY